MCYKDNRELRDAKIIESKLGVYPEFIQNYFTLLPNNSTKRTNNSYIYKLLVWLIEQKVIQKTEILSITPDDLSKVSMAHIIKYLEGLETGLYGEYNKYSTITTKKNVFGSFWSYLLLEEYVQKDIIRNISKRNIFPQKQNIIEIPSDEIILTFLVKIFSEKNEFIRTRNIAIIVLMAGTGMRKEEVIGIETNSFFTEDERVFTKTKRKGNRRIEEEKKIELRKECAKYLNPYLELRKYITTDTNALFVSNEKNIISPGAITNIFKKSSDVIHPHIMRHIFATNLYAKTKDLVLVQKRLDHKSYDTTSNMYISANYGSDFFILLDKVVREFKDEKWYKIYANKSNKLIDVEI